jgi:hypothetical protein
MVWHHQESLLKSLYRFGPVTFDIVLEPFIPLLVESVGVSLSENLDVIILPHVFCHVFDLDVFNQLVSSNVFLDLLVLLLL